MVEGCGLEGLRVRESGLRVYKPAGMGLGFEGLRQVIRKQSCFSLSGTGNSCVTSVHIWSEAWL